MSRETPEQREERIRKMLALAGDPKHFTDPVTPEEIEADKRRSAELLAASGATLTDDERAYAFAMAREKNARANIEVITNQMIDSWFGANQSDLERLKAAAATQNQALARALRDQGRLDEAIAVLPSYAAKLEVGRRAIERDDDWECDCSDPEITVYDKDGNAVGTRVVSRWQPLKRIKSVKHGAYVFYLQCSRCGEYNARPTLPARLFAQIAVASDPKYAPEGKGPDTEVLANA